MRVRVPGVLVLVLALLGGAPASARVLLVGVDGASWSVIDPMLEAGELPHLAALLEDGVGARLDTVEPVNSPTVWTSIATGRRPEAHGVTGFLDTALRIRVPTIFERLAARGVRVGLYDYLMTWPPRTLPGGFVIPGWMRRDDRVTPADAFARAGLEPPYRYALDGLRNRAMYLANARRELARKAPQWNALARAFEPEVGALTFYAVDALSHRFWADAFPDPADGDGAAAPDPRDADAIHEAMRGVDTALGALRAELGPEDTLLLASDHGFRARDEVERVWASDLARAFRDAGLVPRGGRGVEASRGGQDFVFATQFAVVLVRVNAGPFAEREALAERIRGLLASARTEDGDPLYTVDVFDMAARPPEARRPLLTRLRQWALGRILQFVFEVELDPDAHAYVLARPDDEVLRSVWPAGRVQMGARRYRVDALLSADDFSGAHDPTAVFAAAGGPVRALPERARLSVLDVAPLLAYLAGAPIPDDLEGALPTALLEPAHLEAHPPRRVPASELPGLPELGAGGGADEGERALIERLRSMGYVR